MSEYISRDEALNFEMEIEADPENIQAITTGMAMYSDYLGKLSVIHVTRCRDCVHLTPSAIVRGKGHCAWMGTLRPFDWFCANGRPHEETGESVP